jgi:hypothetical protein
MTIRPTIAFGPETKRTSWAWVGFDVGRELSKYFNVIFFPKNIKQVPQADLVFFIKNPPDNEVWTNLKHRSIKMVYCPIDNYSEESAIQKHAAFLGQCEAIFVHCSRLSPILKPYCKQVDFIEHYNRFGLSEMTAYKPSGYAVWVGTMENLPPVINWLQEHPLGLEIKFVTDYPVLFKDCITGALPIKDNHELIKWHPKVQNDIMSGAKVAFDIKGSSFNQMHKPPVKAQQFIVSGIPFATNQESYSAEYFMAHGLKIPSPMEMERWLSIDYWKETKAIGQALRERITLENIGLYYKRIIENILGI